MTKKRFLKIIPRLELLILVLGFGLLTGLAYSETESLALVDLSEASVEALAAAPDGDIIYARLVDLDRPTAVYRSENNGRTWQVVGDGPDLTFKAMTVHPADDLLLYAGTVGGALASTNNLWRSENGGQNWSNANLSLPAGPDRLIPNVTALVIEPAPPHRLFVGTDGQGVYRFTTGDNNDKVELVGDGSLPDRHIKGLAVGSNRRLYAVTGEGLFVTNGERWQKIESLPEMPVSLVVAPSDPRRLYVGTTSVGAYRSDDGGQSWEHISRGLSLPPGAALRGTALAVDRQDADHLILATAYTLGKELAPGAIYESDDGGSTWHKVADLKEVVTELTMNRSVILAATPAGMERVAKR